MGEVESQSWQVINPLHKNGKRFTRHGRDLWSQEGTLNPCIYYPSVPKSHQNRHKVTMLQQHSRRASSRREFLAAAEQKIEPLQTKGLVTEALPAPAFECGCEGWSSGSYLAITI